MNTITSNPYSAPASQPQPSVGEQFPQSGVQVMPQFTNANMTPGQRAVAAYRSNPNAARVPPGGAMAPTKPAELSPAPAAGPVATPSTHVSDALTALQMQRGGGGSTIPAAELSNAAGGGAMRGGYTNMPQGGGDRMGAMPGQTAVMGGTNAGGVRVGRIRPPSRMMPVRAYR